MIPMQIFGELIQSQTLIFGIRILSMVNTLEVNPGLDPKVQDMLPRLYVIDYMM